MAVLRVVGRCTLELGMIVSEGRDTGHSGVTESASVTQQAGLIARTIANKHACVALYD